MRKKEYILKVYCSSFYWQESNFQLRVFKMLCDYLIQWSCGFMGGTPSPSVTTRSILGTMGLAEKDIEYKSTKTEYKNFNIKVKHLKEQHWK